MEVYNKHNGCSLAFDLFMANDSVLEANYFSSYQVFCATRCFFPMGINCHRREWKVCRVECNE